MEKMNKYDKKLNDYAIKHGAKAIDDFWNMDPSGKPMNKTKKRSGAKKSGK